MALSGVSLTFYLFPEAPERRGRGWKSLASFLPSEPHCPFGLGVCSMCGSRERNLLSEAPWGRGPLGLHVVRPAPSRASSLQACLRQAASGTLAALSLIVCSALGRVLGNSESRKARPQRGSRGDTGLEQGPFLL